MPTYYSNNSYPTNSNQEQQSIVSFILKGIKKIPKALYNVIWNIFWRYLK